MMAGIDSNPRLTLCWRHDDQYKNSEKTMVAETIMAGCLITPSTFLLNNFKHIKTAATDFTVMPVLSVHAEIFLSGLHRTNR